jgi:hypothetical protein
VALLDALAGLDRPVILERARIARGDGEVQVTTDR